MPSSISNHAAVWQTPSRPEVVAGPAPHAAQGSPMGLHQMDAWGLNMDVMSHEDAMETLRSTPSPSGSGLLTPSSFSLASPRRSLTSSVDSFAPSLVPSLPQSGGESYDDRYKRQQLLHKIERVILSQRANHQHYAEVLCRSMMQTAHCWRVDISRLFLKSGYNLPLYSVLLEDLTMFALLGLTDVARHRKNHALYKALLISHPECKELHFAYYDLEIHHYVESDNLGGIQMPSYVQQYLDVMFETFDPHFVAYIVQSRRLGAECALMLNKVALAETLLRLDVIQQRPMARMYDVDQAVSESTAYSSNAGSP